jgi:acetyl esterase/lipase
MAVARALLKLPYGPHPRTQFDLIVPEGAEDSALVICLHGGWWTHGRHEDLRAFCLALAEQGLPSATIDFRPLGEGARHGQDILDELRGAIDKVLEEAAVCGLDGRSLVLLGSGSGSLLALLLAAQLGTDPKLRVRACIACGVTPSLDHADVAAPHALKAVDQFAGSQRHALSPITLRPDGFPPLLLLHGDSDGEIPAKVVHRFHMRVVEGGEPSQYAVLTGVGHQFIEQPHERAGKAAMERILPFLREVAPNPAAPAPSADER